MTIKDMEKKAFEIYSPCGMGFDGAENERAAFIEGAEWMQEQHKALDVHTDNSEVIANLQAEVERLKVEKEQMIKKASKWLNENADNYISQYCKCMEFGFVVMFERAMREV